MFKNTVNNQIYYISSCISLVNADFKMSHQFTEIDELQLKACLFKKKKEKKAKCSLL